MARISIENPRVRSYRELLGVSQTATADDLKKAYYKLASLYHPDRNPDPNAAQEFQKVREAYETLLDSPHIQTLNDNYLREQLHNQVIEGLNISFGSLFGYRSYKYQSDRVAKELRLGQEKANETDSNFNEFAANYVEQDSSILDNAAFDAIETVYAGKFSIDDEERLQGTVGQEPSFRLPWVVLNNQGLLHFLDGDFKGAQKCFAELNERIPNNIMFMYRLGLCYVLLGFKFPKRTFLGIKKPDRIEIERGLKLFRHCIQVGENRSVGKQKCLVIRKLLAEILEKIGQRKQSLKVWQEILDRSPRSVEATLKLKGPAAALSVLQKKVTKLQAIQKLESKDKVLISSASTKSGKSI